jgi:hypothetical protein
MFLRIEMDVPNQLCEIFVARDANPAERMLEETACSAVRFVDGFGVCVE